MSDSRIHVDYSLMYYRNADKFEVDVVIENAAGKLVGVEVKAAPTVKESDFRGLKKLASVAGADFNIVGQGQLNPKPPAYCSEVVVPAQARQSLFYSLNSFVDELTQVFHSKEEMPWDHAYQLPSVRFNFQTQKWMLHEESHKNWA